MLALLPVTSPIRKLEDMTFSLNEYSEYSGTKMYDSKLSALFFKDFFNLYIFEERNIDQLPLIHAPTRYQSPYPGMCPDLESNWWDS